MTYDALQEGSGGVFQPTSNSMKNYSTLQFITLKDKEELVGRMSEPMYVL